jgi:hypothetical protein
MTTRRGPHLVTRSLPHDDPLYHLHPLDLAVAARRLPGRLRHLAHTLRSTTMKRLWNALRRRWARVPWRDALPDPEGV